MQRKFMTLQKNVQAVGELKAIVQSVNVIFVWAAKYDAKLRKKGQKLKASVIVFFSQQWCLAVRNPPLMSRSSSAVPDQKMKRTACFYPTRQVKLQELECFNHQRQETVKWLFSALPAPTYSEESHWSAGCVNGTAVLCENRNTQVKLKIWSCFNLPCSAAPGITFVELKPTSALLNVAVRMLQRSRSVTDSRRLQQDQSAPRCQRCVSVEPDAARKKNKEASADSSPLISLL